MMNKSIVVPAWIEGLMGETYFVSCEIHHNFKKNEKNIFCLHCCQSFCPHCVSSHHPQHSLLQVRRYVYQNVIRLDDLEMVIDCSFIQPYTINGAKVIFLNERTTQSRCHSKLAAAGSNSDNACFTCHRVLQQPFNFCSLSCKVNHFKVYQGGDLSSILYQLDEFDFGFVGLRVDAPDPLAEEGENTPNCSENYEEPPEVIRRSSKKKSDRRFLQNMFISMGNRRKGAPQRSPLA